jgi:uroporphyrinogen-III synthase
MRVLVTRAAPECHDTALRVSDLGHEAIVSPVLEIESQSVAFDPAGVQALAFTSAAGVRAFAHVAAGRAWPVLAVGEATADAARRERFTDVRVGAGTGAGIVALAHALDPQAGAIVHVSGEDIASDVVNDLCASGFTARRLIAYRAAFAKSLAPYALELLTHTNAEAAMLFHSARGAEAFIALARAAGVQHSGAMFGAMCLSARIAEAARPFGFNEIRIAAQPRETSLLALLAEHAADRA